MPIIDIYIPTNDKITPVGNKEIATTVANHLSIPAENIWIMWHQLKLENLYRVSEPHSFNAPIIFLNCRSKYSTQKVASCVHALAATIAKILNIKKEYIFCAAKRIQDSEIHQSIITSGVIVNDC